MRSQRQRNERAVLALECVNRQRSRRHLNAALTAWQTQEYDGCDFASPTFPRATYCVVPRKLPFGDGEEFRLAAARQLAREPYQFWRRAGGGKGRAEFLR